MVTLGFARDNTYAVMGLGKSGGRGRACARRGRGNRVRLG